MRRFIARGLGLVFATLSLGVCGDSDTVVVDVGDVPETLRITINGSQVATDTLVLDVGESAQLSGSVVNVIGGVIGGLPVSFATSNASVATVNTSGQVNAIAPGVSNITATGGGITATMPTLVLDTVSPALGTLIVSPAAVTITGRGSTTTLTLTAVDSVGTAITPSGTVWVSNNTAVATVNATGVVTAISAGIAEVRAENPCCTSDTSTVTVVDPQAPPPSGVLFSSDWSTATGSSDTAVRDGGRWNTVVCYPNFGQVLQVVPGSQVGWTRTANVMQITNRGSQYCGQVNSETHVPQRTSYYIRFYARVEDENTSNFHPIAINCCGDIQMVPWSIDMGTGTAGQTYAPVMGVATPTGQPLNSWRPRQLLQQRQWYRFEYHIEYIDTANLRFRIWPRISDMSGTLLYDADDFVSVWDGGGNVLAQYYAGGGYAYFRNADLARRFAMGYEGSAIATDQGRRWYYADVEIRGDTWPGP